MLAALSGKVENIIPTRLLFYVLQKMLTGFIRSSKILYCTAVSYNYSHVPH